MTKTTTSLHLVRLRSTERALDRAVARGYRDAGHVRILLDEASALIHDGQWQEAAGNLERAERLLNDSESYS